MLSETTDRIENGSLPRTLENSDWRLYVGRPLLNDWQGFCQMWSNITYVRYQAFMRDYDAEDAAEDIAEEFTGEREADMKETTSCARS